MGHTYHHQEPSFMLINYTTLILIMVITVNLCFANLDERMRQFGLRPRLWEKWMGKVSERWAGGERASIIFNIIIIILPSHQCSLLVFIIIIRVSERCTGCVRASIASIIMIHDPNHLNPNPLWSPSKLLTSSSSERRAGGERAVLSSSSELPPLSMPVSSFYHI